MVVSKKSVPGTSRHFDVHVLVTSSLQTSKSRTKTFWTHPHHEREHRQDGYCSRHWHLDEQPSRTATKEARDREGAGQPITYMGKIWRCPKSPYQERDVTSKSRTQTFWTHPYGCFSKQCTSEMGVSQKGDNGRR